MNQEMRIKVGELWLATALTFGKEIPRPALTMMLDSISDLDPEKVLDGFRKWMRESKIGRYPFPSEVRELVEGKVSSRDLAIAMARKIDKAVSKFGLYWPMGEMVAGSIYFLGGGRYHWTFKDAVIAELGPVGWHTICSRGGWAHVRNSANEMEEGTFFAQMRDQIESSYNLQKQGVDITKIKMIEAPDYNSGISNLINLREIPK